MGLRRFFFGVLTLALSGCTALPGQQAQTSVQMMFAAPPTQLYAAVPAACSGPGERVVRSGNQTIECRRLLPPEGAAGAILRYDGTIDELPESVIRFESSQDGGTGTLVKATAFVAVPQRDGREVHVIYPDAQVNRKMREMLTRLGGQPVAP